MKDIFFKFLSIVFVAFTLSAGAQASDSEDSKIKEEVLASFESLVRASKSLDIASYFQHFDSQKFIGLNSDGTNWNALDELTPLITTGFNAVEKVDSLEFSNVKVSVIDSYTAVLVNEYSQSMTLKNGMKIHQAGGGTQVWSKRSGHCKLVSVSASNKVKD